MVVQAHKSGEDSKMQYPFQVLLKFVIVFQVCLFLWERIKNKYNLSIASHALLVDETTPCADRRNEMPYAFTSLNREQKEWWERCAQKLIVPHWLAHAYL